MVYSPVMKIDELELYVSVWINLARPGFLASREERRLTSLTERLVSVNGYSVYHRHSGKEKTRSFQIVISVRDELGRCRKVTRENANYIRCIKEDITCPSCSCLKFSSAFFF